jgi:membrane-associated phospholipid phosphatase
LNAIRSLRSGTYPVTWRAAEGVIAFPSFHVTWGILLMAAYRRHAWRLLFIPLNGLMIATAVTSGMHYVVDVAAGFAVGMLVIAVVHCRSETEASWLERAVALVAGWFGSFDDENRSKAPLPGSLSPEPASNG